MTEIKVLDKGFVRLVDSMGNDESVVRSARVSYGRGTKTPAEDEKLINFLLKNEHGTPFEHTSMTFHVKCPIFVMRQWIRHRIGNSFNEISGRYTELKDEFFIPTEWRAGQDPKNKQGSAGVLGRGENAALTHALEVHCLEAYHLYERLIKEGVSREMARMVLPLNIYTEFYWTVNARSLMAFIKLRSEQHAQFETQQYSNALAKIFTQHMPWTSRAFYSTLNLSRYPGLEPKETVNS